MKKKSSILIILLPLIMLGALIFHFMKTHAAVDYNNLIDTSVFENYGSTDAGQIDTFLNTFPNSCISQNPNGNGDPGFRTADPQGWSNSLNRYTFGGNVTAGQAIYDVAQNYHVNPQVILATLEKEQGVVSGGAGCHYNSPDPSSATTMTNACGAGSQSCTVACIYSGGCMNIAMSYGCPNYCKAADEGFSLQLTLGTWLLRFAEERAQGITSGYAGYETGDSSIGYSGARVGQPYTLADGNTITAQNGATASLYYYTPFEHGNLSFDNIFTYWFGSVKGDFSVDIGDNGDPTQYLVYGSIKQVIPSTQVKIDWGLGNYNPITVSSSYLGSVSNGPTLSRLFRVNGQPNVYFVDGGIRYWVSSQQMMDAWNNFNGAPIASVPSDLGSVPSSGGSLTYNIKNSSSNSMFMVDGGDPNTSNANILIRLYPNTNVLQAFEGDNPGWTTITDTAYFNSMTQGTALTAGGFTVKTANDPTQYQVIAGQKMYLSGAIALLYNQTPQIVSQATINRLYNTSPASEFIRLPGNGVTIYMVDNGQIHAISSLDILESWLPSAPTSINILDQGYLNLIPGGSPVNSQEADVSGQLYVMENNAVLVPSSIDSSYRIGTPYSATSSLIALYNSGTATLYAKSPDNPAVYLMDGGTKRHITSSGVYSELAGNNPPLTILSDLSLNQFSNGSDISSNYVTTGSGSFAIDNGNYYTVTAPVASDWGFGAPISISASTFATFTSAGALSNAGRSGSSYYLMKYGASHLTFDTNLANIWGINISGANLSQAFVNSLPAGAPLTIFVKSTDLSDQRIFVTDSGGKLYSLNSIQQVQNYGYISGTMIQLTPTDISNMAITSAQNILQQSNTTNYVALDSGAKRAFSSAQAQSNWLASGNQTSVSNYLWNFIPSGASINSTIKSSAPNVYAVQSGQKDWIQSGQTYNSTYAPYTNVSDYLTFLLPNGPNIP